MGDEDGDGGEEEEGKEKGKEEGEEEEEEEEEEKEEEGSEVSIFCPFFLCDSFITSNIDWCCKEGGDGALKITEEYFDDVMGVLFDEIPEENKDEESNNDFFFSNSSFLFSLSSCLSSKDGEREEVLGWVVEEEET
jgi:hypothetical protein